MPLEFFSPVRESKKNYHLLTPSEIITSFFSSYIYFSALTTTFLVKGTLNTLPSHPSILPAILRDSDRSWIPMKQLFHPRMIFCGTLWSFNTPVLPLLSWLLPREWAYSPKHQQLLQWTLLLLLLFSPKLITEGCEALGWENSRATPMGAPN